MTSTEALTKAREEGGYAVIGDRDAYQHAPGYGEDGFLFWGRDGPTGEWMKFRTNVIPIKDVLSTDWTWQPTLN